MTKKELKTFITKPESAASPSQLTSESGIFDWGVAKAMALDELKNMLSLMEWGEGR